MGKYRKDRDMKKTVKTIAGAVLVGVFGLVATAANAGTCEGTVSSVFGISGDVWPGSGASTYNVTCGSTRARYRATQLSNGDKVLFAECTAGGAGAECFGFGLDSSGDGTLCEALDFTVGGGGDSETWPTDCPNDPEIVDINIILHN